MKFDRVMVLVGGIGIALISTQGMAADGTINFTGMVTDQTCEITTPAGVDFTVTLPRVSTSTLSATGETAGRTPFSINLSNCSSDGAVATYFEPGPTVDSTTGRLINQNGSGATNVEIQLLGDNHQVIPVRGAGPGGAQDNSQWVTVASGGGADLDYYAEYYATDASTAGPVNTSVQYTIVYQ